MVLNCCSDPKEGGPGSLSILALALSGVLSACGGSGNPDPSSAQPQMGAEDDQRVVLVTGSTGEPTLRFAVLLADPPGGVIRYLDLEPVEKAIYRLTADLGLVVLVAFQLESERREIEAGTYYG